jgi:hypothetical protein
MQAKKRNPGGKTNIAEEIQKQLQTMHRDCFANNSELTASVVDKLSLQPRPLVQSLADISAGGQPQAKRTRYGEVDRTNKNLPQSGFIIVTNEQMQDFHDVLANTRAELAFTQARLTQANAQLESLGYYFIPTQQQPAPQLMQPQPQQAPQTLGSPPPALSPPGSPPQGSPPLASPTYGSPPQDLPDDGGLPMFCLAETRDDDLLGSSTETRDDDPLGSPTDGSVRNLLGLGYDD